MQESPVDGPRRTRLLTIRAVHTVVWAFFAGCILAIPLASWRGDHAVAAALIGVVLVEVLVLLLNGRRCPLTDIAARYTDRRSANFDIFLPEWLARHNQLIFGALFACAIIFAAARYALRA
jgi:uncharacterized membrane protein